MHNELTQKDLQLMREELDYRRVQLRPKLLEAVKEARAFGDLSENFEYKAAKQEKNRNESRIRFLENMIKTAVVIADHSGADTVGLYDRVTVYLEEDDETEVYQIVTTMRQDALHGLVSKEEFDDYIDQVMDNCGLQPFHKDRYPHEFSGGQRQRICIARALALNPEFIVCDEPVSALDVSIQAQIINLLKNLQEKYNLTYLFISHDLSVVEYISDTVGVMYLGNLVEYGATEDIFRNPLHPYTKALFSAIPVPDPTVKMDRIVLEGSIPSPANPPAGCKFHTRCANCMEKCKTEVPQQREIEPGHYVVCHLYDEA